MPGATSTTTSISLRATVTQKSASVKQVSLRATVPRKAEAAQANLDGFECSSYTWQARHHPYSVSELESQVVGAVGPDRIPAAIRAQSTPPTTMPFPSAASYPRRRATWMLSTSTPLAA